MQVNRLGKQEELEIVLSSWCFFIDMDELGTEAWAEVESILLPAITQVIGAITISYN